MNVFTTALNPNKVVQVSLWPLALGVSLLFTLGNFISYFILQSGSVYTYFFSSFVTILVLFSWFKDMVRESEIGFHSHKLEVALRLGMLLFILSEVFFFLSFFWTFFDSAMAPTIEYGLNWPPKGIVSIAYYSVPLLNTVILLTSGVTITWAHHALVSNDMNNTAISLALTILLGIYFLYTQVEEYMMSSFSMADGVYGSIFFMATGFHGSHVLVGVTFLSYIMVNLLTSKLTFNHHFSFEAAAWYWHFVDVVWLFLFLVVYIWFA